MEVIEVCIAKYPYVQHAEDEISFKKGEKFILKERHKSNWFVLERLQATSEKKEGLAPGNFFKIVKIERKKKVEVPKVEVKKVEEQQQEEEEESDEHPLPPIQDDEEDCDEAPPPLPGPPPAWSDTIAGKAAIELAKQLKKDPSPSSSKSPRSPRPVMDVFAQPPKDPQQKKSSPREQQQQQQKVSPRTKQQSSRLSAREKYLEENANAGGQAFGIALKKTGGKK